MMCAIMNKLRRISTAARHRPVFDLRIPALLYPAFLTPAEARRTIGPCFFSSGLTQPLFTKLANLLQNRRDASEQDRLLPSTLEGRAGANRARASRHAGVAELRPPIERRQILSRFPLLHRGTHEKYCSPSQAHKLRSQSLEGFKTMFKKALTIFILLFVFLLTPFDTGFANPAAQRPTSNAERPTPIN